MPADQTQHDRRIDYIELPVTDIGRARAFYSTVFGWKMTDWGPDYASFEDGRLAGGFRPVEGPIERGGPLVVVYAIELEAIEEQVKDAGGTIVVPTFSFPGGRRFHFTDTEGNELAVWTDQPKP